MLHRLLLEEARYRGERSLAYRLVQAKLPWPWTLETFPFEHVSPVSARPRSKRWPGSSSSAAPRTWSSSATPAPARPASPSVCCAKPASTDTAARFYKAQDLIDELYASLADRSTAKLLNRLARYPVLVIDELGYLSVNPEQTNAFFNLLDRRYNRVSTVITTNLDFPQWYEQFQRKSLVDALLDRLQHHCITIRIDGPSLRAPVPPDDAPPTAPKRSNKKTKEPPNKPPRSTRSRGASPPT